MIVKAADELWDHFVPLWNALQELVGDQVSVAGGYGLYLKQLQLIERRAEDIVVPISRWKEGQPRVTKDLDLIVGLLVIGTRELNQAVGELLLNHGFVVSKRGGGKRWQFEKKIGDDRWIVVELHAPTPPEDAANLKQDKMRIKHTPSLGDTGVHGRHNPEAVGFALSPGMLEVDGVSVQLPNPVTWAIMKLTAMNDHWEEFLKCQEEGTLDPFSANQAIKHGRDVCRVVAMMSREERAQTTDVIREIRETPEFQKVVDIVTDFFGEDTRWIDEHLAADWEAEDFGVIREMLRSWFTGRSAR